MKWFLIVLLVAATSAVAESERLELVCAAPSNCFGVDFTKNTLLVTDAETPPDMPANVPYVVTLTNGKTVEALSLPDGTYGISTAGINADGEIAATIRRQTANHDIVQQVVWPADGRHLPPMVLPPYSDVPEDALIRVVGVRTATVIGHIIVPGKNSPYDDQGGPLVLWRKGDDGTWNLPSVVHDFGGDFPDVTNDVLFFDNGVEIRCGDSRIEGAPTEAVLEIANPNGGGRLLNLQTLLLAAHEGASEADEIAGVKQLLRAVAIRMESDKSILVLCNGINEEGALMPVLLRLHINLEVSGATSS